MEINKLLSTIILFIITLIMVFVFVIPEYKKSNDLQLMLAQKQAEYSGKEVYYKKVSTLIGAIESNHDSLQKVQSALPPYFSLGSLVYFFQKKAAETGLVVKLIVFSKISPATMDKKFRNIDFTMNLSGNYQSLKNFLSALDKSSRLFEVNAVYFKSSETPRNLGQLKNPSEIYDFNLEVQTHSY